MKITRFAAAVVVGLGLAVASVDAQPAAPKEISLLWPGGGDAAIKAIIPSFEAKTGYKVIVTKGTGAATRKQIASGAVFDVAVLQAPFPEVLASGNVVVKSQKKITGLVVGVVVKKGAPKPDVSTPAALKKLLLSVKSISYPDPNGGVAAGVSFGASLEKMGLTAQVSAKAMLAKNIAEAVKNTADGKVEIGIAFLSEIDDSVDIAGPLPPAVSQATQMFGFVTTKAKDPVAAQALLDYLASPAAAAVYASQHMQLPE